MKDDVIKILNDYGIQPSAQRVAVAEYVLTTDEHPSADQVFAKVASNFPMISRATIYNTLNLFVEKGLLRELHIAAGRVVFDPKLAQHHHFINEETGEITDIEGAQLRVSNLNSLNEFEISDYQVILRGKKK
ncbi:MAG TPA: transcriptional repressor [Blastocatellia bacterium]|nr:transcriptional repressor [Blastocatellia bacterium]